MNAFLTIGDGIEELEEKLSEVKDEVDAMTSAPPTEEYEELREILREINSDEFKESLHRFKDDERIVQAINEGSDLKDYIDEIEEKLDTLIDNAVPMYFEQAEGAAALFEEIQSCDRILEEWRTTCKDFRWISVAYRMK